jgi:hypothetical protein
MELHAIGIDLGKTVFHLVGLNLGGEVVVRKKCSRKQLLHFTANLKVELIGMEACGGSHFLGRALREQGHEVRLIRIARHTTRIALSSGHALHLHLPWSSPNATTLLSRGNSCMRSSIGPSLALLQRYRSMR